MKETIIAVLCFLLLLACAPTEEPKSGDTEMRKILIDEYTKRMGPTHKYDRKRKEESQQSLKLLLLGHNIPANTKSINYFLRNPEMVSRNMTVAAYVNFKIIKALKDNIKNVTDKETLDAYTSIIDTYYNTYNGWHTCVQEALEVKVELTQYYIDNVCEYR